MKTDLYTKAILTVIAACMLINVLKETDVMPRAYAAEKPITSPAVAPGYALVPVNKDGSINVTVTNTTPTDVNIVGIKTYDRLDVDVNLEKIGGYSTYGEIPVKVKQ